MKRREFLDVSLRAGGIALVAPGLLNLQACSEINKQFSGGSDFSEYDLVINGAGLFGYFAAINAAEIGKKVLLVEKRTFPGYEITAKRKLWLGSRGIDNFRPDLMELFLPPGEKEEIQNMKGEEPESSRFGDEVLLFAGSVKKTLLRRLLVKKVHVLLMTDVCGILSDNENVKGVLLAGKHGLHTVRCSNFIDASDNVIFSRKLLGDQFLIKRAGFVMELENVLNPQQKNLKVSEEFGLHENNIKFHQGKRNESQLFIEFDFPVNTQSFSELENKSRLIAADIGEKFTSINDSLGDAKISQFAFECSISLENNKLPDPLLKGYYMLSGSHSQLNFEKILEIEDEAKSLTKSIKYSKKNSDPGVLLLPGIKIPYKDISISDIDEPGLAIPMKNCSFDYKKWMIDKEKCQVLVAGGGTAGAMAAMGAGEKGAGTIVVDYFNDLGGTKTMGGVMGYYHCVAENLFLKTQEKDSIKVACETNSTNNIGRRLYHMNRLLNSDGKYISGAIICGSVVNNKKVEGVLICRNGELGIVNGDITIDATGDGDIAIFAGEKFKTGDSRAGKTQNYSQWDIPVKGKLPSQTSRDYDIIDNTKISELQRGLFLSHYEAHYYDFNPMLTVRESRQIEGLYTTDLIDAVEGTHFEDLISLARSDFDPHYVANSEFSRCGFLLPHSNLLTVEIPYRSIVPKNIDGLLVSGRAISVTHNSMQFTRMSGDILVLGYFTGQIAADIASQCIEPRSYSVSENQKDWVAKGFIPAEYLAKTPGNQIKDKAEIIRRVTHLSNGEREYLYECIRIQKELILPLLYKEFDKSRNSSGDLLIAKALAWFGEKEGNDLIESELNQLFQLELKEGYSDGYIENYDFIRGREKNQLEGLFWRINQNIALLAMAGNPQSRDSIKYILENTSSGGPVFKREGARSAYFNERIDLRLIPYYNRILNLCFYADRLPDHSLIPSLEKLLADDNINGFVTEEYFLTRWRVYRSDLELFMASSLARCGSEAGYELLISYLSDIHYRFKLFSVTELKELTDEDFGFNPEAWTKHLRTLEFPRYCKKLVKPIEV